MRAIALMAPCALLWLLFAPVAAFATAPGLDLMDAYKKEYAFIEAERDALAKRLAAAKRRTLADTGRVSASISAEQKKVIALRSEADKLTAELEKLGRESTDVDEQASVLPDTLERATQRLDELGATLPPVSDNETASQRLQRLKRLVTAAASLIAEQGTIKRAQGVFFAPDGSRVEGTVVQVGEIARFGVSEAHSGALAPAGNGHFRLWPAPAAETATALAAGNTPESLAVFLYDAPEKAVELKSEKTVHDIIESGGTVAWVIVGLGMVALLLLVIRALLLLTLGASTRRGVLAVVERVSTGQHDAAVAAAGRLRGAAGRIIRATLTVVRQPRQQRDDVVAEAVLAEVPRVERFGTTITVIAAVAPLMGLLGTVTGMIATFDIITEFGTGDPKLLAGGISEALVTTELGLIVAIPTLLLGTLLNGRAAQLQIAMERGALQVINAASLHQGSPESESMGEHLQQPSENKSEELWMKGSSASLGTSQSAAAL